MFSRFRQSAIFNNLNDQCWIYAPTSPVLSCRFLYVPQKHYMHQSHWRHSRRLMNADTLDGEASLNTEALSVVGREAACQISAALLSFSARLCFAHICCHFCLYSFEVFSCAPHLNDASFALHGRVSGQKSRSGCFHTLHQPIKY